jgi:hypothetical protein
MGTVKIKRLKEWSNRRFNYKIIVDGQEQFEIANGQERILTVDDTTTLQAKLMWCGSEKINIAVDKEQKIKEVRVKANKGPNIRFPFLALTIFISCGIINLVYPDNALKGAITSILVGVIIYAVALVTIWRNKFLDIELVTE